nr:allo37 [Herpesvirus DDDp]
MTVSMAPKRKRPTTAGYRRSDSPSSQATRYYADGALLDGRAARRFRTSAIPATGHRVTVVSESVAWKSVAQCLANDPILTAVLSESVTEFDVEFALDTGISAFVRELSDSEAANGLIRGVIRWTLTDDLVCYLTESYKRFVHWIVATGGCPIGYVAKPARGSAWNLFDDDLGGGDDDDDNAADADGASRSAPVTSRAAAFARTTCDDEAFGSYESAGAKRRGVLNLGAAAAAAALAAVAGAKWTSEIAHKINCLAPEELHRVVLATCRIAKRLRDGHVPYVPRLQNSTLYRDHTAGKWIAVEKTSGRAFREFRWLAAPEELFDPRIADNEDAVAKDVPGETEAARDAPAPTVRLSSIVYDGIPDSCMYRDMKRKFVHATAVNLKRSIVTAPDSASGLTAESQLASDARMKEYFTRLSSQFPQQFYDDVVRLKSQQRAAAQMAADVASAAGVADLFVPSGAPQSDYNSATLLECHEDNARRKLLSDMANMLDNYKHASDSYTNLTTFLDAKRNGCDASTERALYSRLGEVDRDRLQALLAALGDGATLSSQQADKPTVHRLPEHSKLISMYTATVGLPDIEELHHGWTLMWKTRICGVSFYTRRKNTIQYNSAAPNSSVTGDLMKTHFCAVVNFDMKLLQVSKSPTALKIPDIFMLNKVLQRTTGVAAAYAHTLNIKPSDLTFHPIEEDARLSSNDPLPKPKPKA